MSHFLLDLQDITTVISDGPDSSRPSFVSSNRGRASSLHFATNSIIDNLGSPLRGRQLEHNDNDGDAEVFDRLYLCKVNEEGRISALSLVPIVREESIAGPSRIPSRASELEGS